MKSYKVVFRHGHFIDVETKRRIIPIQGKEFVISANSDAFNTEDYRIKSSLSKNSKEKEDWARKEYGTTKYSKLAPAGGQFMYRIGNTKMMEGDENNQYVFLCSLLEDLYLYLLPGKETKDQKSWRLADCNCKLEKCVLGGLTVTDQVEAQSLNQLFSRTVVHYFANQRSAGANAFNAFFFYDPKKELSFHAIWNDSFRSLGKARKEYVESL